jgi:hypothetical protein
MLYQPDYLKDNPELRALASAAFQVRIHQCDPSSFQRYVEAMPIVTTWTGYKVDILLAEYLYRQQVQLRYVEQGDHIEDTYYSETRSRAIGILSELAERGLLNTMQCRSFDQIVHS